MFFYILLLRPRFSGGPRFLGSIPSPPGPCLGCLAHIGFRTLPQLPDVHRDLVTHPNAFCATEEDGKENCGLPGFGKPDFFRKLGRWRHCGVQWLRRTIVINTRYSCKHKSIFGDRDGCYVMVLRNGNDC